MKLLNKKNEDFIELFFKNHKVFFCDSLPWKLFNFENAKAQRNVNQMTRIEYLFSEYGFFNETYKERDSEYIERERKKRVDYVFYHRQRRYIVQELISDNFHNPTHHSFIIKNNHQINFEDIEDDDGFKMVTHPGHTRFQSSCYLKKNLNKCLLYVNKDEYYDGYFKDSFTEIKSIEEAYKYWRPAKEVNRDNLVFDFLSPSFFNDEVRGFKNGTKYHKETKCNILKLWELQESPSKKNILHTQTYIEKFFESSEEIAEIMFEKRLTIYTNSKDDVSSHFNLIRKKLIKSAELLSKRRKYDFYFDNVDKFEFDVVVVDSKPNDISALNDNKGFAIWIDKSVLNDIDRDIYEFTFFTRKDIKLAETEDGKLSVVNCRNVGDKRWKINKEFYL